MVQSFEAIAHLLGLQTQSQGRNLFWAHSARVSGAQYFAGVGLEVQKTQLLGRWADPTVIRYVAEALLASATSDVQHLLKTGKFTAAKSPSGKSDVADRLSLLESSVQVMQRNAAAPAPMVPRGLPVTYVVNLSSQKLHAVCNRDKALCGWAYNHAAHSFLSTVEQGFGWRDICETCLPAERSRLRDAQYSGSESESSVSTAV